MEAPTSPNIALRAMCCILQIFDHREMSLDIRVRLLRRQLVKNDLNKNGIIVARETV